MSKELIFKGEVFNGTMDLDKTDFVCVPSPKYKQVDLCLKDGWNIVIGTLRNSDLSYEEKEKLGKEIERRWNYFIKQENEIKELKELIRNINGASNEN